MVGFYKDGYMLGGPGYVMRHWRILSHWCIVEHGFYRNPDIYG